MFVFNRQRLSCRTPGTHGVLLCLFLSGALPLCATPVMDLEELRRFFETYQMPVSHDLLNGPMEDALIKAIDPRAAFVTDVPTNSPCQQAGILTNEFLPDNIFYCRINALNGDVATALKNVMGAWTNAPPTGTILDLRQSGGHQLEDVDAVASLILDDDAPLYRVCDGAGRVIETHRTRRDPHVRGTLATPLILLTSGGTIAAAEVLAASLKNHPGVMLIGTPTAGDSGLREVVSLPDGRKLNIATRWISPFTGPGFQNTGVIPDLHHAGEYRLGRPWLPSEKDLSSSRPLSEKARRQYQLMARVVDDAVLSRAADILIGLRALNIAEGPSGTAGPPQQDEGDWQ